MTEINDNWKQSFQRDGFALVKSLVDHDAINTLLNSLEAMRQERSESAGIRLLLKRSVAVRRFAKSELMMSLARDVLGSEARPVKAILFDKTPAANWFVTWHQDLTIATKQRFDLDGFGAWSVKEGTPHVQPPSSVLENIVAMRVHLDDCPEDNGAIKFVPGTHAFGILDTAAIEEHRDSGRTMICPANSGDVILMRPLILHASSPSKSPDHRRVLHIEYSGAPLPSPLKWAE